MNKEMTVREAFELAYGPIPKGATCHALCGVPYEGCSIQPCYNLTGTYHEVTDVGWKQDNYYYCGGPDISDRPAHAFLGFFGDEYDKVVKGEDK